MGVLGSAELSAHGFCFLKCGNNDLSKKGEALRQVVSILRGGWNIHGNHFN